jgi:AsmA protein
MRRLAVIITVLVILAGGALSALYLMFSANSLATHIAEKVEQTTGRKVIFGSSARLRLWPEFGVSFSNVKLSNPPDAEDGVFAEVETLRLDVELGALMRRRADIEEIKLINPTVHLVVDEKGRGNWETARAGAAEIASTALQPIYVEGGTVNFLDRRSGESHAFRQLDLAVGLASLDEAIDIKGSGDWRQDRVSFSLFVKSPQLLAGEGTPIDLNVSGSWLTFAFSGRATVSNSLQLAGTIEGGTRSLRRLAHWGGFDIGEGKGLGALHWNGALSLDKGSLSIDKAHFTLDGMRAQGDVAIRLNQDKPHVTARLDLDALDLNQYIPTPHQPPNEEEGLEGWSGETIDFSPLNSLNASARLTAARLVYGRALMTDAVIEVNVADGILNAKLDRTAAYGGKIQGQVVLNGKQKVPTLQASVHGSALEGYRFFRNIASFPWLSGRCEFAVAVAATGRSQREMMASLRGTAGFAFGDGKVRDVDLPKISEAVSKNILNGWILGAGEGTSFRQLKANFAIADGIAQSKELTVEGEEIRLSGTGLVDLLKREVDLKMDVDLAGQGALAQGIGVPVVVRGPWGKPKFYPDIAGVLENPEAAYETLNALIRKARVAGEGTAAKGEKPAEGEELLGDGDEENSEGQADLLKKQINSEGMDLMNGFTGEGAPQIVPAE